MSNLDKLKEVLPFEFIEPTCICEFRIPYETAANIIRDGFNPAPLPESSHPFTMDILQSIAQFAAPLHPRSEASWGPSPLKATLEHVQNTTAYRLRIYRNSST